MKPTWDKLMKSWNKGERAKTSLIADVDCTAEASKALCEEHGVEGFPTIKWGDPNSLDDYEGERDWDTLKNFAKKYLKPVCSPANIDLCDGAKKKEIAELQALPADELDDQIEDAKKKVKEVEAKFDADIKQLEETYEQKEKEKTALLAEIKASGLGLMQAVLAHAQKGKDEL